MTITTHDTISQIVEAAKELGYDWNRQVYGEIGYGTAYTGSCYAELVYMRGKRFTTISVRVSDHAPALSKYTDSLHVDITSPDIASQIARVMSALGDGKARINASA